jgi:hypothetical protein
VAAGVISTVAGGVGGPAKATDVGLFAPCGVSYSAGSVYAADGSALRKINPRTDWLTTPAGNGIVGPAFDGLRATRAPIDACTVAFDRAGNAALPDTPNNILQVAAARTGTFYGRAMTAGHIYTVAGNGSPGFSGDGGPATDARLSHQAGVAVDRAGNILIADTHSSRIRVVAAATGTFYGQAMTAREIYTVAGGGKGRAEDGGPAAGARLAKPMGMAVGAAGSIVIADTGNGLIRIVTG